MISTARQRRSIAPPSELTLTNHLKNGASINTLGEPARPDSAGVFSGRHSDTRVVLHTAAAHSVGRVYAVLIRWRGAASYRAELPGRSILVR